MIMLKASNINAKAGSNKVKVISMSVKARNSTKGKKHTKSQVKK
jgi:hypothetical protein